MYVEIVLLVKLTVKTAESIAVDPSVYVTAHVSAPQVVRPRVLVTSVSVQLNTAAVFLISYDKAGVANFVVLIVSVSRRHLLMTSMLKFCVARIAGNSLYFT